MHTLAKRLIVWAILVGALLTIPLIGNWPWTGSDYVFGAVLLCCAALAFELISKKSGSSAYRYAVGVAVIGTLLLMWINGAVGIIGSENNPANMLYAGVIAIGLIGAFISRLKARGMSMTLYAMAAAQLLIPVIAAIIWKPALSQVSGIIGVIAVNAFFALLFAGSATLFRRASMSLSYNSL